MAATNSPLSREPLGLDFDRTASWMAYLSAAVALAYSVSFGYYVREGDRWAQYTSSGLLIAGGLIGLPVLVALYLRVRHVDEGFAIVGLVIAAAAALGTVLHGAHDIAVLAVIVYIGRVTVLDPKRWWVAIAAVGAGVIGVPLWNVLVGRALRTNHAVARVAQPKAPPARNASISVVS